MKRKNYKLNITSNSRLLSPLLAFLLGASAVMADDWPAFRHDAYRSGVTEEQLRFPLRQRWVHVSPQRPAPAWSAPVHILDRLDFDRAPHPIIAGGMVYYASTADDTIRALDLNTGAERWHFVTGGPVRLAPQVARGRLFAGSDDGYAYCLDAGSGKLLWKFRAGPGDDMVIGNRRMISRWPLRTGVLVVGDVAYITAGMWNAEGIHICALNADTGEIVWRNDNAGYLGMYYKGLAGLDNVAPLTVTGVHEGEFGVIGLTPQGALLAFEDLLIIPNGSAFPARFSRLTGEYLPWPHVPGYAPYGAGGTAGGTWNTIDDGMLYSLYKYRENVIRPMAYQLSETTSRFNRVVVRPVPNISNLPDDIYNRGGRVAGFPAGQAKGYTHDGGKASIVVQDGKLYGAHAYGLALAGDKLVLGLDGAVAVQEAKSGKEIWRTPVDGVAREIAVADGRIIASTENGVIHCFAPAGQGAATPLRVSAGSHEQPHVPMFAELAPAIRQLSASAVERGYALVLGDADGRYSMALAAATELHVINALPDVAAVTALRERLLASSALYGSRIHVLPLSRSDQLPFARYFANVVVIAGPLQGMSPRELYRVLRPYGGMLFAPAATAAEIAALHKQSGAAADECGSDGALLRRKALSGAFDANRTVVSDKLVVGPMRLLWFGGPQMDETQNLTEGLHYPVAAAGNYFVLGEHRCSSVDIYNGTVLWSHIIPRTNRNLYELDGVVYRTDEPVPVPLNRRPNPLPPDYELPRIDHGRGVRIVGKGDAQLVLGSAPNDVWINIDGRSGRQKEVLGTWRKPAAFSLQKPLAWKLGNGDLVTGEIGMAATVDGLRLTLRTSTAPIAAIDSWNLNFDFRPLERRCGLYEQSVFQLFVKPANAQAEAAGRMLAGPAAPPLRVIGRGMDNGSLTEVVIAWQELEMFAGGKPGSFGFAATLNWARDASKGEIARYHLFGDWSADALNYGWANIFVDKAPDEVPAPSNFVELSDANRRTLSGYGMSTLGKSTDNPVAYGPRVHPLTGELVPKIYRSGNGSCGLPTYSDSSRYGRAIGMLGLYDFIDDSGLRTFSGIKAGCSTAITPAMGVLLVSPESGHCVCTYPYPAVTVTLAPADKRLNEDWAMFHDRPVDTLVRQAAINMGAFGDRRDNAGTLWLGFPRAAERAFDFSLKPGQSIAQPLSGRWLVGAAPTMPVPLRVEFVDPQNSFDPEKDVDVKLWPRWIPNRSNREYGPVRVNTDIVHIAGTDRPWIYGSQYRGLTRVTMTLDLRTNLVVRMLAEAPLIDGATSEAEWGSVADAELPFTGTRLFLRHDRENIYVAMRRAAVVDRLGKVMPWQKRVQGDDAAIWEDDSCEVFLSDVESGKVVHFGVSASGARYDALVSARGQEREKADWNGVWRSAARADEQGLSFELAIPLQTLISAGLALQKLGINVQMNQKELGGTNTMQPVSHGYDRTYGGTRGEALSYLGPEGREHCRNFMPLGIGAKPVVPPRRFNVRLHFAELDDVKPGERVFDVKLQGQTVIKGLDVVKEAGGRYRALVKEVNGVLAGDELVIEFVPTAVQLSKKNAPILNALELREEGFVPPRVVAMRP